jgi:hypothetical protein
VKITIDCDRRIRKLNIEFSDEYDEPSEMEFSETSETSQKSKKVPNTLNTQPKKEKAVSFEIDEAHEVIQDVIEKPIIEEKERTPLVAGEMQNLEF